VLDRTLVVVTADHGEEFLEHGRKGHGQGLYEELVRIPLIVWSSERPATRIEAPVSLADVAPTVLDYVGLDGLAQADGRSLLRHFGGEVADSPPVFSALWSMQIFEQVPPYLRMASVRQGSAKLIHDVAEQTWQQFDLGSDPAEQEPGPPDPELKRLLDEHVRLISAVVGARSATPGEAPDSLPPEEVERLRALGYLD
jgi:arylsulfatase A-like enzyme